MQNVWKKINIRYINILLNNRQRFGSIQECETQNGLKFLKLKPNHKPLKSSSNGTVLDIFKPLNC